MKKILSFIIVVFLVASTFSSILVDATNEPNAAGIGFTVDASTVKMVGYYDERVADIYVTDYFNNRHKAGTVKIRGVEMTSNEDYLGKREDTWLTRTIVEPNIVSGFMVTDHLLIIPYKAKKSVPFSISTVSEITPMPTGLKMSAHMSTTTANQITKTVKETWTISGNASLRYKGYSIGSEMGITWTTSTDKVLAKPYDSSRNDKEFNVKYTFLDPWNETMSKTQDSFCRKQCIIYSSKSVYGTASYITKHSMKTTVSVRLLGHFVTSPQGSMSLQDHSVSGDGAVSSYIARVY